IAKHVASAMGSQHAGGYFGSGLKSGFAVKPVKGGHAFLLCSFSAICYFFSAVFQAAKRTDGGSTPGHQG
ncbi:MAG: hypothetical protein MUF76_12945, partial [Hydrogenophaga sp.]|nr:hypothetical protein [Hydrogenophaga sp.]